MQPGQTIAHYEILGSVGEGGMGVVYRARDTKLGRIVALKFLPADVSQDEAAKQRFMREAQAASALDHANICTIHDIAETDDGQLYIVMGYYEGRTLGDRLKREAFSVERCRAIGRQLAAALEVAHGAGIVHRDIKPANIMIDERDEVKLLDFGVAKLTSGEDLTAPGGTVGTIAYMSPEQLHGEDVDGRTDLWALGVVLYEMLGGKRPFDGDNSGTVITGILQVNPEPLESLRSGVPVGVASLVRRCLEKDRERRPVDAAAVGRELAVGGNGGDEQQTRTFAMPAVLPVDRPPDGSAEEPTAVLTAASPPVRRALPVIGVVLFLIVAAAAVYWWSSHSSVGPTTGEGADLLAVLPFTVRGSGDLAYLGEGMIDLMSARLDGVGGVATINPRVVISRLNEDGLDPADPTTGVTVAARLGAGRFVTGSLLEVGGRVTLTAYLYQQDEDEPLGQASVEGETSEVFDLVDTLVASLLTDSTGEPGDRLRRSAAMSSRSLEATKEYLRGEQFLRTGQYRDAAEAYDMAIEIDPEFAMAYYRKSVAADWIDSPDVRSAADRAFEFADQLTPRDRSLLEALRLRRHGRNQQAAQAYRSILHRYPDEAEAWIQLSESLFHDNPRSGRNMLEAVEPFQRVLDLDPANSNARIHLARLYALAGDSAVLEATADYFAASSAGSERALEVEALYAFSVDDPARQDAVVRQLEGKPDFYLFYTAHGVARFTHSVEGARRILEAGKSVAPLLLAVQASLYLEQGRFEAHDELLAGIPDSGSAGWDLYRAFMATSGVAPTSDEELVALADRVGALDPEEILQSAWLPPNEDFTAGFAALERDYYLALLWIQAGRLDEARDLVRRMGEMDPLPGVGSMQGDALSGLEAEIHLRSGDEAAALVALQSIEYEVPHAATVRSIADGSRSRFLRAELERRAGDLSAAKAYYLGLDQSWSWWDTGFRPGVYRGLGEIAEREGRPEEAIDYYSRLLELWRDCDPSLHAERARIEAALGRLAVR